MTIPPTEIPARPVPRVAKELLKSSGFLLARVGIGFKTQALAKLEEWGFDPYDYSVLAILAEGAREAQATLADTLGLDPSRVVAVLDSLERRELVERQRDPHGRRRPGLETLVPELLDPGPLGLRDQPADAAGLRRRRAPAERARLPHERRRDEERRDPGSYPARRESEQARAHELVLLHRQPRVR